MTLAALATHGAPLRAQTAAAGPDSGGVVSGVVREWVRGVVIPRAYITLQQLGDRRTSPRATTQSDSAGRFRLRAPGEGAFLLEVRGWDFGANGPSRIPVHVRRGDTVRIDLFVPPYGFDAARRLAQLDTLAERRRQWARHEPAEYRATVVWECFCSFAGEWLLHGARRRPLVSERSGAASGVPPLATVDSLFGWLERSLRDPLQSVDVHYDSALGYPTKLHTDTVLGLTDLWTRVEIRSLVPVASRGAKRRPAGRSAP